jgi:hypothetical protein
MSDFPELPSDSIVIEPPPAKPTDVSDKESE